MERFGPSILVEAGKEKLLFDCGRGATQRLFQLKVPFGDVNCPVSDSPAFRPHRRNSRFLFDGLDYSAEIRLPVWGPAGTAEMMSHLQQAYQFDIHIRRDVDEKLPAQGAVVVAKDIEQGVVYQNGDLKVTAFTVDHAPVKPAFGYRVDYAGHSVVLSGDTRYSENLIQFAQGADVLIHEVTRSRSLSASDQIYTRGAKAESDRSPHHAGTGGNSLQPGEAKAGGLFPYRALQRPDLVAQTRKTYSGPLEVGEDLMSIEIGDKVEVHRSTK